MLTAEQGASRDNASDPALVSIVLCTYNGSRFLGPQLDSLLAQTWPNIEIIVADDHSADDSVAILNRCAERDERLRVVVNPVNLGFARNFENALRLSRGTFVAPCDQDDIWLPDKITVLMTGIEGHSMAYCDSTLVDELGVPTGYRLSQVVPMRSIDDPLPFAFGNCVSGHAMLFRRTLLERALPVPQGFFYDWWLAAVAAAADGICFRDQSLVLYRQHGDNITAARLQQMFIEAGLAAASSTGAKSTPEPETPKAARDERKRASALCYLRETEQRLKSLAELPGRHRQLTAELLRLWQARELEWLSIALWRAMTRHQDRLLALTGMSRKKRARYLKDFMWGLRAKRLATRRTDSTR